MVSIKSKCFRVNSDGKTFEIKVNPDGTASEIKTEGPLKDILKSEQCYIIVSDEYRKVFLWKGVSSHVRSRFIISRGGQDICRQLGIRFRLVSVNEGEKDPDFIKLIGGKITNKKRDEQKEGALSEKDRALLRASIEGLTRQKEPEDRLSANDDDDDDDRFPYPYVFKPPNPPDDFEMAPQEQVHGSPTKKDTEDKIYCQYCGRELTKEEQLTHSCQKRPEKNNG